MILRPYTSDNGPTRRGPMPRPRRKKLMVRIATSFPTRNSSNTAVKVNAAYRQKVVSKFKRLKSEKTYRRGCAARTERPERNGRHCEPAAKERQLLRIVFWFKPNLVAFKFLRERCWPTLVHKRYIRRHLTALLERIGSTGDRGRGLH